MRRSVLLAFAAVTVVATPVGVAEAAPVKCNKLAGKNLAKNGKVKVVRTKLRQGRSRYFGCVLPRGTVRPIGPVLGPDADGLVSSSQSITLIKGTFVIADFFVGVGQTSTTASDSSVYNLATGKSYVYDAQSSSEEGQQFFDLGRSQRAFLDGKGRLVASYIALDQESQTETATIVVFSATGKRKILDQGPQGTIGVSTLKLVGRTASWLSDGVKKTYTLP